MGAILKPLMFGNPQDLSRRGRTCVAPEFTISARGNMHCWAKSRACFFGQLSRAAEGRRTALCSCGLDRTLQNRRVRASGSLTRISKLKSPKTRASAVVAAALPRVPHVPRSFAWDLV